jgi:hypothetical protein
MENWNKRARINVGLGVLALGTALASVPAFAQEVWQTYPMTISSPAFGPGPAQPFVAPAARPARPRYARRSGYNSMARVDLPQHGRCEVWQTYPMTISSPADYVPTDCQ